MVLYQTTTTATKEANNMSKKATCQLTRKEGLAKGSYYTMEGGNIKFDEQGNIKTLGTKQGVCFIGNTEKWFIDNSKWIMSKTHCYTGAETENVYRLGCTLKVNEADTVKALALLTTKYLFTVLTAKNGKIRLLSCKYAKFQKLSKVLDELFEQFEVLDYGVCEYDMNDGFVRELSKDCKLYDTIKQLQHYRAQGQWSCAWITDRPDKVRKLGA